MMRRDTLLAVLVVFGVVVGSLPAAASGMALGGAGGSGGPATSGAAAAAANQQSNGTRNDTGVNVSIGQQLSTVVSVTRADTAATVERRAFTIATEGANESSTAAAVAERAAELRTQAVAIREAYHNATAAYEAGEITASEYAQRLAELNARARSVRQAHQRLRSVAANVSALQLRAAGYQPTRTREAVASLAPVTGVGANALRERFTGERRGNVAVETGAGLDISVGGEQGQRVRELDRQQDDNRSLTVSQTAALDAARAALSRTNGTWVLTGATIRDGRGSYHFTFRLDADATRGRATVVVDGSSGAVVRLHEQVGSRNADRENTSRGRVAERGSPEDVDGLVLLVAGGSPQPGETVTLQAVTNGTPAENVTVQLNGRTVGTTGRNGTVTVTLPTGDDATVTASRGDAEATVTFAFDEARGEQPRHDLNAIGSIDNGTVTLAVTYGGNAVADAAVYADGERVGTTDADGTLTFSTDAVDSGRLVLVVVKGEFEATLTFTVADGDLAQTDTEVSETGQEAGGRSGHNHSETGDDGEDDGRVTGRSAGSEGQSQTANPGSDRTTTDRTTANDRTAANRSTEQTRSSVNDRTTEFADRSGGGGDPDGGSAGGYSSNVTETTSRTDN